MRKQIQQNYWRPHCKKKKVRKFKNAIHYQTAIKIFLHPQTNFKPLPPGFRSFHLSSRDPLPRPLSPAFLSLLFTIPSFFWSFSELLLWSPDCRFFPKWSKRNQQMLAANYKNKKINKHNYRKWHYKRPSQINTSYLINTPLYTVKIYCIRYPMRITPHNRN